MSEDLERLGVSFIVYGGYYSDHGDWEKLLPHTKETKEWYEKGLMVEEVVPDEEDVYEGVCVDNGELLAQWDLRGETVYIPIV